MLAEKVRKEKWSLNPRGNLWSSDSNKVGQRLLEKMGWKAGCGLGANLQGPTEIIRVAHKKNNRGLGFKSTVEDVEHQSTYNRLLEQLNGGQQMDVRVTSLEQQSRQSRARVHYQKFTRGKDLSRCSNKDLLGILGKDVNNRIEVEQSFDKQTSTQNNSDLIVLNGGNSNENFRNTLSKFDYGAEKHCADEVVTQCDVIHKSKKKKKRIKNSNVMSKLEGSEPFVDTLLKNEAVSDVIGTCSIANKFRDSKSKLKKRAHNFLSQVLGSEFQENQAKHFSVNFTENDKSKSENCAMEVLVDNGNEKNHGLYKKKYKSQEVSETALSEDKWQDMKVKKKIKNELNESLEKDGALSLKNCSENDSCEANAVSQVCGANLSSEGNGVFDGGAAVVCKSKKKRKLAELTSEEMLQQRIMAGISKGPSKTDFGFKGSNVMCIKGYANNFK